MLVLHFRLQIFGVELAKVSTSFWCTENNPCLVGFRFLINTSLQVNSLFVVVFTIYGNNFVGELDWLAVFQGPCGHSVIGSNNWFLGPAELHVTSEKVGFDERKLFEFAE